MDKLRRRHFRNKDGKRAQYEQEYLIYTEKEAQELSIAYKPWYSCQPGENGLSDDKFVAECLKVAKYTDNQRQTKYYFTYPYGAAFGSKIHGRPGSSKLLYLPHKDAGSYDAVSTRHWSEQQAKKARYKNFVKVYVKQMLADQVNYEMLGTIISKDEPHPSWKAKYLLKQGYIKKMIDKEIESVLREKGLTMGHVIDMLLTAAQIAKDKNDAANLLRAAENFIDIYGMKSKMQKSLDFEGEMTEISAVEEAVQIEEDREGKEALEAKFEEESDVGEK